MRTLEDALAKHHGTAEGPGVRNATQCRPSIRITKYFVFSC